MPEPDAELVELGERYKYIADSIQDRAEPIKAPTMPVVLRFIEPCLPSPAERPPSGSNWIHEIKHDGYRLMARRDPVGIRLITPPRQRLVRPVPPRRRGREPSQGPLLPDRRGGGLLR
jgi:hypothetical protein